MTSLSEASAVSQAAVTKVTCTFAIVSLGLKFWGCLWLSVLLTFWPQNWKTVTSFGLLFPCYFGATC